MKIFDFKVDEAEIIPYLGLIFGMKTSSKGSKTISFGCGAAQNNASSVTLGVKHV